MRMTAAGKEARRVFWQKGRRKRAIGAVVGALTAACAMAAFLFYSVEADDCRIWRPTPRELPLSFAGAPTSQQHQFIAGYYEDLQNGSSQSIASHTYPFDPDGAGRLVEKYRSAAQGAASVSFGAPSGSHVGVCLFFPASRTWHLLSIYQPMAGSPWAIDTKTTLEHLFRGCPTATPRGD
jgi:hypothetical protein